MPQYTYIDTVYAPFIYTEGATQQIIQQLKYYGKHAIANEMARHMHTHIQLPPNAVLVPVPLHWRRWLWRGFNQAEKLAQAVATLNELNVQHLLRRTQNTQQQAKLERKNRLTNVETAFTTKAQKVPKHVILIDDVAATGATLSACAQELKRAGANRVDALVYAVSEATFGNQKKKA